MSEIPESLRGTYTTPSMVQSDALEPRLKKGDPIPLKARFRIGATRASFSLVVQGQKLAEIGESDPRTKIQNIATSHVLGEEEAHFNMSDADGKPDTAGGPLKVDKDGLHLTDLLIEMIAPALMAAFANMFKDLTEEERAAGPAKVAKFAKDQFGVLTRSQGTEDSSSSSLPLMVGGGAALLLLLMVK